MVSDLGSGGVTSTLHGVLKMDGHSLTCDFDCLMGISQWLHGPGSLGAQRQLWIEISDTLQGSVL